MATEKKVLEIPKGEFFVSIGEHLFDDGIRYQRNCHASNLKRVRDELVLGEGDVMIATYARSGTTWMQRVLWNVTQKNNWEQAKDMNLHDAIPYIEKNDFLDRISSQSPRLMKTHLNRDYYARNINSGAKFIIVARNPKDILASFYNFYQKNPALGGEGLKFDDFFRLYEHKRLILGDPCDFLKSWLAEKNNNNVLFVNYEDMKENVAIEIERVANFLNIELTEQELDRIIIDVNFQEMRVNSATNHLFMMNDFIRKGVCGDWKNYLDEAQMKLVDERCQKLYEETGFMYKQV